MQKLNIAIIGATGLVGRKMLKVLEEFNFPVNNLYLGASKKSVGKELIFKNKIFTVDLLSNILKKNIDIAIFSAGSKVSIEWAPKFAEKNIFVIDNSSAWRMDDTKKLIVPEINANILTNNDKIIANPNCSTIQMVMALYPLHKNYKIKRIVVSTYQSITGSGKKAIEQLNNERKNINNKKVYPYDIDKNCLPHCDVFTDNAYTKEEMKLINETQKILNDYNIRITATAVRVPVVGGHSESINVEFENNFKITDVRNILENFSGVKVLDDINNNIYPMPKYSENKNQVFVGRIRRDYSQNNSLNMWVVADNLRKGAATNAIQIADYLLKNIIS